MGRAERRKQQRLARALGLDEGASPSPLAADTVRDELASQVTPELDPLERLRSVRASRVEVDRAEGVAWVEARAAGHSWLVLGDAVGISRSAAQQRHAALKARFDLK